MSAGASAHRLGELAQQPYSKETVNCCLHEPIRRQSQILRLKISEGPRPCCGCFWPYCWRPCGRWRCCRWRCCCWRGCWRPCGRCRCCRWRCCCWHCCFWRRRRRQRLCCIWPCCWRPCGRWRCCRWRCCCWRGCGRPCCRWPCCCCCWLCCFWRRRRRQHLCCWPRCFWRCCFCFFVFRLRRRSLLRLRSLGLRLLISLPGGLALVVHRLDHWMHRVWARFSRGARSWRSRGLTHVDWQQRLAALRLHSRLLLHDLCG